MVQSQLRSCAGSPSLRSFSFINSPFLSSLNNVSVISGFWTTSTAGDIFVSVFCRFGLDIETRFARSHRYTRTH